MKLVSLLLLTVVGCLAQGHTQKVLIYQAFYHERGHYSVMIDLPDGSIGMTDYWIHASQIGDARFKFDVPADQRSWLETDFLRTGSDWSGWRNNCTVFTLHLHDPREMQGGSWEHRSGGKNPTVQRGRTNPLQ